LNQWTKLISCLLFVLCQSDNIKPMITITVIAISGSNCIFKRESVFRFNYRTFRCLFDFYSIFIRYLFFIKSIKEFVWRKLNFKLFLKENNELKRKKKKLTNCVGGVEKQKKVFNSNFFWKYLFDYFSKGFQSKEVLTFFSKNNLSSSNKIIISKVKKNRKHTNIIKIKN
jgi:hypothetical protein